MLDDEIRAAVDKVGVYQGMHYSVEANDLEDRWCVVALKGDVEKRQDTYSKMKSVLEAMGLVVTMGEEESDPESFGIHRQAGLDSDLTSL